MSSIMNTGVHLLHLSNDKVVTLMATGDVTLALRPNHKVRQCKRGLDKTVHRLMDSWSLIGVRVTKHVAGFFKKHSWGHTDMPNVVCELRMYRIHDVSHGPESIDSEQQVQWYVHLNLPVEEIAGAIGKDGYTTELFESVVCQPLWDMGLQGTTPLSDVTPTGQMCVSYSFHVVGRRVIVCNRHYRDV